MPIFTNTISNQNTSYQSGIHQYPNLSQIRQFGISADSFNRESLNPANSPALYTVAAGSSGTAIINSGLQLQITTAATNGDYTDVRTSGLTFVRYSPVIDINRNTLTFEFCWNDPSTTNIQLFIGISNQLTGQVALPGSAIRHMGIYLDTSVSNNYKLTSSDGTTQTTTDTGQAISNGLARLQIVYNANTGGTINFSYDTAALQPPSIFSKSQTVSAFVTNQVIAVEAHFFVESLSIAAKTLNIREWQVSST